METLQNLTELRNACGYRLLARTLRVGGIGSIVFGFLALSSGMANASDNPLAKGLALLGLALIAEGIYIAAAPSPGGIILEGAVFLVVGFWNFFVSAAGGGNFAGGLGLLQLMWAIQYFRSYSKYSKLAGTKPSKASLAWLEQNIKSLASSQPDGSHDVIEFRSPALWKARLFPSVAVVASGDGRQVFVASKNEVRLQQGAYDGKVVKVFLKLGEWSANATITPQSLSRLSAWRGPQDEAKTVIPQLSQAMAAKAS